MPDWSVTAHIDYTCRQVCGAWASDQCDQFTQFIVKAGTSYKRRGLGCGIRVKTPGADPITVHMPYFCIATRNENAQYAGVSRGEVILFALVRS